MDSPLLVVLLLCLTSPGRTEDASLHLETSGEHPEHIPMIPLQPSTRIELHSTSEAPRTNPSPTDPVAPPGIGPTADLPEDLYPQTTPTTPPPTSTTTTSETSLPSHTPAPSREPHSEESLTAEFIHDVVSVLQPVDIDLSLPALSLSSENNLLPQLLDMGLAQLASQPELVKISTLPGKVNTVHHKVSLEVMEEGGQAARSSPSGSGLSLALSFHVNRPFIFLVRDDTSGAILFIGKVMDPRKLKRS
ncbi:UNVERIFIED_CONTAM: hypothetical protein FKN15_058755 [Acipenser sinensis]